MTPDINPVLFVWGFSFLVLCFQRHCGRDDDAISNITKFSDCAGGFLSVGLARFKNYTRMRIYES